jgi:hypothetical protein
LQVIDYIAEVVLKDENSAPPSDATSNGKKGPKSGSKNGEKKSQAVVAATVNSVSAQEAAESLIDLALEEGSTDNISAIIVKYL